MSGDFAAAGDLATGGLIGRAMEPHAGEHVHGAHRGGLCLNCGTTLAGEFCHACGQTAHVHTTLTSIVHDLLHGVFHFDGKIFRTLPMLFTRPGALTRRYIAGERARFVSPLALFLFSVFVMVATFESVGGPFGNLSHVTRNGKSMSPAELTAEIARQETAKAALVARRDALKPQAKTDDKVDAQVDALDDKIESVTGDINGLKTAQSFAQGKLIQTDGDDNFAAKINTGMPSIDDRIRHAVNNPELYAYKLQSSAYKFSWLLIPISLPFIWLMFAFRRDVGPYDHAIFAIYSLSAMTLGVVGLSLFRAIGVPGGIIGLALTIGPPLHMYKQLRGAYRIGRFAAAWRTIALLISASIAALLFFIGIVSLIH